MCRFKPSPDCRVVSVTRPDEGERGPGGAGKAALYAALLLGPARSHAEETGPSVEGVAPLMSEGACHHRHLRARLLLVLGKPVMWGVAGPCLAPVWGFREEHGSRGTRVLGSPQRQEWGPAEHGREPAPRTGPCPSPGLPHHIVSATLLSPLSVMSSGGQDPAECLAHSKCPEPIGDSMCSPCTVTLSSSLRAGLALSPDQGSLAGGVGLRAGQAPAVTALWMGYTVTVFRGVRTQWNPFCLIKN